MLDGLRGVAALLIVIFHHAGSNGPLPHAYLVVDFFFLLSGFVVASAYEPRLLADPDRRWFFRARLVRLYPLYFLGTVAGLIVASMTGVLAELQATGFLLTTLTLSWLMLPTPGMVILFPLDGAAWSLFLELIANAAYAVLAPRLGWRGLIAIMAISGVGLIAGGVMAGNLNFGTESGVGMLGGLLRVTFSFTLGVTFYRLHTLGRLPTLRAPAWAPAAALIVLAMLPGGGPFRWVIDVATVLVAFPIIMLAGIEAQAGRLRGAFAQLALISYPLYLLHVPIRCGVAAWVGKAALPTLPVLLAYVGLSVMAAWAASRWYDPGARRLLAQWTEAREPRSRFA